MYVVNLVKIINWKKLRWDVCIENIVICILLVYVLIYWVIGDFNRLR